MAFVKWLIVFTGAFCVAFVIILTFSQAPFKQPVPAMIFAYRTPPITLYWYVIFALAVGLIVGLAVAVYNYFTLQSVIYKKSKTIRELEEKIAIQGAVGHEMTVAASPEAQPLSPEAQPHANDQVKEQL